MNGAIRIHKVQGWLPLRKTKEPMIRFALLLYKNLCFNNPRLNWHNQCEQVRLWTMQRAIGMSNYCCVDGNMKLFIDLTLVQSRNNVELPFFMPTTMINNAVHLFLSLSYKQASKPLRVYYPSLPRSLIHPEARPRLYSHLTVEFSVHRSLIYFSTTLRATEITLRWLSLTPPSQWDLLHSGR